MQQLYVQYDKTAKTTKLLEERENLLRNLASIENQEDPFVTNPLSSYIVIVPSSLPLQGSASIGSANIPVSNPASATDYSVYLNYGNPVLPWEIPSRSFVIDSQQTILTAPATQYQKPKSYLSKLKDELKLYRESCGRSLSFIDDDE